MCPFKQSVDTRLHALLGTVYRKYANAIQYQLDMFILLAPKLSEVTKEMPRVSFSPWICVIALVASFGCGSSQSGGNPSAAANSANPAADQAAPPKQEQAPPIVIPAGTTLSVVVDQSVSSKDADAGARVAASLADPIIIDGRGVIPKGARISGRVTQAKSAGKFKGSAELGITLTSLEVGGQNYTIHTSTFSEASKGRGERTAIGTGIGAGAGALIGALAGGGKGAAIGAGAGGGAGLAGSAMTGNRDITIAAETTLNFKLTKALEIPQN
jgi:hypothetical protein